MILHELWALSFGDHARLQKLDCGRQNRSIRLSARTEAAAAATVVFLAYLFLFLLLLLLFDIPVFLGISVTMMRT